LNLKRGLSLDMTEATYAVLTGGGNAVCYSALVQNGQRDDRCMDNRKRPWTGTQAAMRARLTEFVTGDGPTGPAYQALERSLAALCAGGTRLRLYINPTHALTLDALYWAGKWPAMELWQQRLLALVERQRAAGCDVRLYDFSGFNSITTEAIPKVSGRPVMANYWEASHYRAHVGRLILARMFGSGAVPDDFGVELTAATLPAHLARLRAGRDLYHRQHAVETAFVQGIVATALIAPSQ
jgi:hypothetical protein